MIVPTPEQWKRIARMTETLATLPEVQRLDGDGFSVYRGTRDGKVTHLTVTITSAGPEPKPARTRSRAVDRADGPAPPKRTRK